MLQLFLDSRSLLEYGCSTKKVDGVTAGAGAIEVQGGKRKNGGKPLLRGKPEKGKTNVNGAAFARRVGVIFR